MNKNGSLNTCRKPYFEQVYTGYSYLLTEASEILWHQFIYDPIQDTFIKLGFEKLIQHGYPAQTVNLHVNTGIHKMMHDLIGNKAHGVTGFFYEIAIHAAVKVVATAAFPFLYPLQLTSYIPESIKEEFIEKPIRFMGIHPLEIVNTVKIIPDEILGMNNSVSNTIDYLTLHTNHFQNRVDNPEYEIYMKSFNIWLESVDAIVHMSDDISVLYNNRHLDGITQKAYQWFNIKYQMYRNSEISAFHHDHKIDYLRGSHNSEEYHAKTWQDTAYTASYYAFFFALPTIVNKFYDHYNQYTAPSVSSQELADVTSSSWSLVIGSSKAAIVSTIQNGLNTLLSFWQQQEKQLAPAPQQLDNQVVQTTEQKPLDLTSQQLDDEEITQASSHQDLLSTMTNRENSPSRRSWYSEPDWHKIDDKNPIARALSDSHLLEHSSIDDSIAPIYTDSTPQSSPARPIVTRSSSMDLKEHDFSQLFCTGDFSSLMRSMVPARYAHVCTTPSHQVNALKQSLSQPFSFNIDEEDSFLSANNKKSSVSAFPEISSSSNGESAVSGSRANGQNSSLLSTIEENFITSNFESIAISGHVDPSEYQLDFSEELPDNLNLRTGSLAPIAIKPLRKGSIFSDAGDTTTSDSTAATEDFNQTPKSYNTDFDAISEIIGDGSLSTEVDDI